MLWFSIPALVGLAVSLILVRWRPRVGKSGTLICVLMLVLSVALQSLQRTSDDSARQVLATEVPARVPDQDLSGGYASADACQECHDGEYASWHQSFHRTMTQVVSPETMAAPLGDVWLESRDRQFHLWRDGDEYWVEMVDPEWDLEQKRLGLRVAPADGPPIRRRIAMSTGSHHYQTYWINGTRGNQLWQVPWVYHLGSDRWIPAEDVIINPPVEYRRLTDWNDACIKCHSVRGIPGIDEEQVYNSRVVDLGIACEACHGPGQAHIESRRQVAASDAVSELDSTIVNPLQLSHERSAQVCGQCHSMFHYDVEEHLRTGFTYRPGDDLFETRSFFGYEDEETQGQHWLPAAYWPDGSVRVAGAEYSSLMQSSCFHRGELSCISCHSLHSYEDRDDQLRAGMRSDSACVQCHSSYADDIPSHTHHTVESEGSRCYNCHMPHSSFALLKGIRSHQIDSPTARMTMDHGRPNACNLCHTDKTLGWTSQHLADWYGHDRLSTSELANETSVSVLILISGDAVQRAVIAWNMGQERSRAASGSDWQPPLLSQLLNDPYSVVRYVAHQAILKFPGMESLEYDFLAPQTEREAAQRRAVQLWQESLPSGFDEDRSRVLISQPGVLDAERLQFLTRMRDDRPVTLPE